jgi:hypothetical protein
MMANKKMSSTASNDEEPQFLYVRSARDDNRVALHEVDEAHPGGSVLVAGDMVRKVADTSYVRAQIRENQLMEVKDAKSKSSADKWLADREKAFVEAGMVAPALVAGDRPVPDEGREPENEDGTLHDGENPPREGMGTDPSRGGVGSEPTAEEKKAAEEAKG